MAVSKEVQATVDKIREMRQREKADAAADALREKQMAELQAKYDALQKQIEAIPVNRELSQEDKDALQHAFDDAQEAVEQMQDTHDELKEAVPANTEGVAQAGGASGENTGDPRKFDIKPAGHPDAPTEPLTSGDVLAANGPANHPAGGSQPMMPTLAFNPDPVGSATGGRSDSGQPQQPAAIETAGGFVVQGGGTTHRAPGSMPESPSSSVVVPVDPDAKAPASTADVVKSGLGDSSQNALIGNDGKPVQDGPGMPQEPSEQAQEAAQKQADLAEQERQRRAENPLNLAEPGTPQAGSPEAEKEAQKRRQEEALKAQQAEIDRNNEQQGKPAPGSPGPDPVSAPVDNRPMEDRPNAPAS